jgi:phosphatidylserine decarboxylase
MLGFLYKNRVGRLIRLIFTHRWISSVAGFLADSRMSRFFIKPFIKRYKIDISEYEVPARGYTTFNEFFCRKLKPNKRTIDSGPDSVISPADGNILVIEKLSPESSFFVKESKFDLEVFLQDKELAKEFQEGCLFLLRLAPHDYHRFHFPFDSVSSEPKVINGKFESVNPIVYQSGIQPLTENERHLIILNSEKFGKVLFLPVGAMMVGKINYSFKPGKFYKKADEFGCFAFGGSSIVMIFSKGVVAPNQAFIQNSFMNKETGIKMGLCVAKHYKNAQNLSN